jgi:hypothetical protein
MGIYVVYDLNPLYRSKYALQLKKAGINSLSELICAPADEIASKVSGASMKKVQEWQVNAKSMIQT